MPYCHKCGKNANEIDDFCGHCGERLREFVQQTEKFVKKKSHKGSIFLVIFFLIILYVALDIWAMAQLKLDMSADGIATSISNLNGNVGYTSASGSTTIPIENPTFVPVIAGRVVYDAGYGSTKAVQGKTGMIIVGPYSTQDLPAEVQVSYAGTVISGAKALKNWIFGGNDKWNANAYMDVGITKFQIARWEK